MFTKINPDKGTETITLFNLKLNLPFTKINPDKGTETLLGFLLSSLSISFTKINPDKGTETIFGSYLKNRKGETSLQRLTPIRGRKPIKNFIYYESFFCVYKD